MEDPSPVMLGLEELEEQQQQHQEENHRSGPFSVFSLVFPSALLYPLFPFHRSSGGDGGGDGGGSGNERGRPRTRHRHAGEARHDSRGRHRRHGRKRGCRTQIGTGPANPAALGRYTLLGVLAVVGAVLLWAIARSARRDRGGGGGGGGRGNGGGGDGYGYGGNDDAFTRVAAAAGVERAGAAVRFRYSDRFATDVLAPFAGRTECGLASRDVYRPSCEMVVGRGRSSGASLATGWSSWLAWSSSLSSLSSSKQETGSCVPLPLCPDLSSLLDALTALRLDPPAIAASENDDDDDRMGPECHYAWHDVIETCMILDRFDAVVFVGDADASLRRLFGGFGVLLREDLGLGALEGWKFGSDDDDERRDAENNKVRKNTPEHPCRCGGQFARGECLEYGLWESRRTREVDDDDDDDDRYAGTRGVGEFFCHRIPYFIIPVLGPHVLSSGSSRDALARLLSRDPDSCKPIPVVLALEPSSPWLDHDTDVATAVMDQLIATINGAATMARNTPMLWVGPPATASGRAMDANGSKNENGKGGKGESGEEEEENDNTVARREAFALEMSERARQRGVSSLGTFNSTLASWRWLDTRGGERRALKEAITQGMMIINWLAMVDST